MRLHRLRGSALAVGLGLLAASCGDSGSPTSATNLPASTTTIANDDRSLEPDPSYSGTIQAIFERRSCTDSACHGQARSASLDLRAGTSYRALVGVAATQEPRVRVIPGDPDASYLVIRLEGRQSVGTRMPQGLAPLDAIDLGNIRNWIAEGAKNN